MTTPNNDTRAQVRVVGSNYTTFQYAGKTIAYLEEINDGGQEAISAQGRPYEFIHPLGYRTPTDIVTSRVLDGGLLTLTIRELWHAEIWEQLAGLAGAKDVVQIFSRLASQPNYVTCTKIITPPDGRRYGKVYHRCVIVQVPTGEPVAIGTLSIPKTLVIAYTHSTPL